MTDEQPRGSSLPEDDAKRLDFPMFDGLLAYFPNALAEVARVSFLGNQQHNPGEPLHWAREKSTDHENKIIRHLIDAGKFDSRGARHSARVAWRALALLQTELERDEGHPMSRGSTYTPPERRVFTEDPVVVGYMFGDLGPEFGHEFDDFDPRPEADFSAQAEHNRRQSVAAVHAPRAASEFDQE